MNTFEIGKEYFARSACDHDCIFTVKIVKRTAKTVTFWEIVTTLEGAASSTTGAAADSSTSVGRSSSG